MNNINKKLPGILVTGASGFIGRHFVIAVSDKFRLFCIARRGQKEVGIPFKDTIHWLQADITKWDNLLKIYEYIKKHGGVDYVLHLAGYYDFTQKKTPYMSRSTSSPHTISLSCQTCWISNGLFFPAL